MLKSKGMMGVGIVALAAASFIGTPAIAQDDTSADEDGDQIVVTGSRIKRDSNLDSSIPVTTLGEIDLRQTSAFNAAEIIRDLPAAGVPGLTSTNSNFTVFSAGLESVDLRNLGDSRTLTLIDGRRVVPGVPGSAVVDFSMIPPDFIESIDIVTGGASSVYGSEAIAGVVNVILKDDFEGVELNYRRGWREEAAGVTNRVSLTAGSAFDRGNYILNFSYENSEGVKATDTQYTTDNFAFAGFDVVVQPLFSTFPEQGRYPIPGSGLGFTLTDDGEVVPFNRLDGFNRQENRRLLVPQERFSAAIKGEYELNEWMNLSTTALYAAVSSDSDIEPFPLSSDDIYNPNGTVTEGAGIPLTNPLIPADLLAEAIALGADSIPFVRRTSEISDREGRFDRTTFDLSVGLDGPLPFLGDDGDSFSNWTYSTYINYGRASSVRNGAGQINVQNMRFALDAIEDPDNAGSIICRDATARAFGCVPINIFGAGAISEEAAQYVAAIGQRNSETEQLTISGAITGDLFTLPAGPIGAAFGAEYREVDAVDLVDALTAQGLNAGNRIDPTVGSFEVSEVFGELLVPIVSDLSFIDRVDFEGAYRFADYSTAGENTSWKYGLTSSMFDEQLRFRGIVARAARAPDVGDLFSGNSQSFSSTVDPCDGLSATDPSTGPQDATIRATCLALPGVQDSLAADGVFAYTDLDTQSQFFFSSGSPLLEPEISDSYSVGFVFEPNFIDGFSGSVDWVHFEIEDAITSLSRNRSASECLLAGNNPDNPFCQNIVRDPVSSKILFSFQVPQNAALFETQGLDVQLRYENELPSQFFGFEPGALGSFDTRLLWTYTDSYEFTADAESDPSDFMGSLGFPYNRANWQVNWYKGPLSVNYRMVYLSEQFIDDDNDCDQSTIDFVNGFFDNPPDSFCYTPGSPDWTEHSLSFNYEFEDAGVQLYGGVDNLTDEFIYIPGGFDGNNTGTETAGDIFDALGRRFYVGFRKTW